MKRQILILAILLSWGLPMRVAAVDITIGDLEQFKTNNPDGQKFEFIRSYLMALSYIHKNDLRRRNVSEAGGGDLARVDAIQNMINQMVQDNANFRVVRNLMDPYLRPENGLILKAADTLIEMSSDQIDINKDELEILEKLKGSYQDGGLSDADYLSEMNRIRTLADRRRASLKKMVEASFYAQKILVSHRIDRYNTKILGITSDERRQLRRRVEEMLEDAGTSNHDGTSYLEASLQPLRDILDAYQWDALDEIR